jgi:hypothetical protein
MFTSIAFRFVLVLFLSFSANAETVRGSQRRELAAVSTVNLGVAGEYAILTKTGISTVPTSAITGNIGVSPIAATAITGFSLTADSTNQFSTSTQVSGGVAHAASYGAPISETLTTAVSNMEAAYTDAAGRANLDESRKNFGEGDEKGELGGAPLTSTLTPGVYTFHGDVSLASSITFEGNGSDIFIIQIAGKLLQVAGTSVILNGGALAKNIFWQVAEDVEVGEGAHMEGILLAKQAVLFKTGSTLNGRVLTQTRCDLQVATITQPAV